MKAALLHHATSGSQGAIIVFVPGYCSILQGLQHNFRHHTNGTHTFAAHYLISNIICYANPVSYKRLLAHSADYNILSTYPDKPAVHWKHSSVSAFSVWDRQRSRRRYTVWIWTYPMQLLPKLLFLLWQVIKLLQANIHCSLVPFLRLVHDCCDILGLIAMRCAYHHAIALACPLAVQVIEHYMLRPRQWCCSITLRWNIQQGQQQMGRHSRRFLGIVI